MNNCSCQLTLSSVKVLLIKQSKSTTWMELEHELSKAIGSLKSCGLEDLGGRTNISLGSGCDLFMKYVTRAFKMEYMVNLLMNLSYYIQPLDVHVHASTFKKIWQRTTIS